MTHFVCKSSKSLSILNCHKLFKTATRKRVQEPIGRYLNMPPEAVSITSSDSIMGNANTRRLAARAPRERRMVTENARFRH